MYLSLFSFLPDSIPKAEVEQLSFLPYLLLLQCLKEHRPSSEEGKDLRRQAFEVGIVHQTLHCLSLSGHHSPRVEERESTAAEPTMLVLRLGGFNRFIVCMSMCVLCMFVYHHYFEPLLSPALSMPLVCLPQPPTNTTGPKALDLAQDQPPRPGTWRPC